MKQFLELCKNAHFDIDYFSTAYVGKRKPNDISIYSWESSVQNPFRQLELGRIYLVIDGEAQVLTKSSQVKLEKGNVYLFPPYSILATKCEDFMLHSYIHFTNNYGTNFFNFFKVSQKYTATKDTYNLFEKFSQKYNSEKMSDIVEVNGLLSMIIAPFFNDMQIINPQVLRFVDTTKFINENIGGDLSISLLADMAGLNVNYFSNCFTKAFGVTPIKYINNKKLYFAKSLLLNTELSINEIAQKCGFSDQYNFSRYFRNNADCPPSKYRKILEESGFNERKVNLLKK